MLTLVEVLRKSEAWLKARGSGSPALDAQLIFAQVLELERLQLFLQFDRPLSEAELAAIRPLVKRRGEGEPMAWILGSQEFWSLDFEVGPGVLVPRPDTETLVQAALDLIPKDEECFVADVCAGSGCVGVAVASERPKVKLYATELSPEALGWLKRNLERHGLKDRAATLRGDLLAPIPPSRPIDVVLSNPPYIATEEMMSLEVARHEPHLALDGGPDGLRVYARLVPEAARRARKAVAVEIGHDQGAAVKAIFERAGLEGVEVRKDLGGRDRVVLGRVRTAAG